MCLALPDAAGMLFSSMIEGFATAEGTARFRDRFPALDPAGHFRHAEHVPGVCDLCISSVGLGTYLGEPDEPTDCRYEQAVQSAVSSGINLFDTAINYRHQRSERNIGMALHELIASGQFRRDEIVVCTKAGYLAFDGAVPADAEQYFVRRYVESGIVEAREVVGGMHCMAPAYLEEQIERSLRNLRLETIDVFYLHNPESQLCEVPVEEFHARLRSAFELLERLVAGQKIRHYGIASWNAFRVPQGERAFIGIAACEALAREVGGTAHHFRFLQLPFNLAMTEAHAAAFQPCGHHMLSALETARRNGLAVVASASLYQGKLTRNLPAKIGEKIGIGTDAQRALQFTRSAPGILAALAGMANPCHVFENIQIAQAPPMPTEPWLELFKGCK